MSLAPYESPTFLGQKDVYMLGLSLPQLLLAIVIFGLWFGIYFTLLDGMLLRLVFSGVSTGVVSILAFGRLAGMAIPMYLGLSVLRIFVKPAYEDPAASLVQGDPEWLDLQEWQRERAERAVAGGARGRMGRLAGRGRQAVAEVPEERRREAMVEMEKGVSEASLALERGVRDGIRSALRGR